MLATEDQPPTEEQQRQLTVLAEQLKLAGNKALQSGESDEALKLYTQGIEAALAAGDSAHSTLSFLYSNRATIRLNRSAFAEVVNDCRKAINADAHNMKAYWRAAKASMGLDLYQQAVEFCKEGLIREPANADLKSMLDSCSSRLQVYKDRKEVENRGFTEEEAMHAQQVSKELAEQVGLISQKVMAYEYEKVRNSRTVSLLNEMQDDTPCYTSLGRGFIAGVKPDIVRNLSDRNESITSSELPQLLETKQQMEKRKTEADAELSEIIRYFNSKKR